MKNIELSDKELDILLKHLGIAAAELDEINRHDPREPYAERQKFYDEVYKKLFDLRYKESN